MCSRFLFSCEDRCTPCYTPDKAKSTECVHSYRCEHICARTLPCEQRLHVRDTSWRAKSSLCGQPFNFLSCVRKIRHAIRKQLVREFRGNQTCENYLRTTLLLELLFCFSASFPQVLSILAAKFPRIVFFRKVFLSYQL